MLHTVKGPTMARHLLRFQSPGNREETQESFRKGKKKKQVTSKDQDQKGFGLYNSNEIPGSKVFESLREVPPRIP